MGSPEPEIAHLEDFIRRFRYKATKAAQVQSRVKQLDKIERIIIPEGMKKVRFSFPPAPHSGKIALSLEGVKKAYGTKRIVDEISTSVDAGTKIAFVGRNGAGKSTLMRLIAGIDNEYEGSIRLGSGVSVAYFSQDVSDSLDETRTVEEEASSACPTNLLPSIRGLLGAFLFRATMLESAWPCYRVESVLDWPCSRCSCTRQTSLSWMSRLTILTWTPRMYSSTP
ncbi:hypothetical protein MASR2M48_15690 [Spirochaetota bacterium]